MPTVLVPSSAGLPSALERFDELGTQLGEPFAVFLDFDGTLAPIVDDPDEARMDEPLRARVARLADLVPVAIVSGRAVDDVASRVGLELVYAGDHGFALRGIELAEDVPLPDGIERALAEARKGLEDDLVSEPGVRLEVKDVSLAVHHRRASAEVGKRVVEAVERIAAEHASLRVREGKQVRELVPDVDWGKGHAVERLREALAGGADLSVVYVGDDVTDEDAFQVLEASDVGVLVRSQVRATGADYALEGVEEVGELLDELTRRAGGSPGGR